MTFVSEDGSQRKVYDFATLPGSHQVSEGLAVAFEAVTGPLGTWRRLGAAANLWQSARQAAKWIDESRPGLSGLAELTAADARMLALSFQVPSGAGLIPSLRALLLASPAVSPEAKQALARVRVPGRPTVRQPYTDAELQVISTVARGIVRRARSRLRANWTLLADYRAGMLDALDAKDPLHVRAEFLDGLDRGSRSAQRVGRAANGRPVPSQLHLSAREAWAFGVLLAGLTSLNLSTLADLPALHLHATAPGEPGIALVQASKPRRGLRSEMTLSLAALNSDLQPSKDDKRPARVLNTSLTTAFGVFSLLIELTEPARRLIGTDRAFVYYSASAGEPGLLRVGLPKSADREMKEVWLREWMTGDESHDELLATISFDRLRKSHLQRNRKPVAHTPDTLTRYLRRMRKVTDEGFQIVREALDAQVEAALTRRRMTVSHNDETETGLPVQDTVLGACNDIEHPPHDAGRRCGLSFWDCLDCENARAFPRHLSVQLLALDELDRRREAIGTDRWISEFAGRRAQLEDIVSEYESAQRELARRQTTDIHRRVVGLLFSGDLDPL
ncbi:hypothetical protein [Streptomyces sp. NBC_01262]|uniref:hypothetical protein n=1 Tax=Streptomyces sp. NBC_01262 TaxID=2903803 RepID=UPI002E34DB75|nr:hypothetical protein [Streptomyces sp. NBC_01262]